MGGHRGSQLGFALSGISVQPLACSSTFSPLPWIVSQAATDCTRSSRRVDSPSASPSKGEGDRLEAGELPLATMPVTAAAAAR